MRTDSDAARLHPAVSRDRRDRYRRKSQPSDHSLVASTMGSLGVFAGHIGRQIKQLFLVAAITLAPSIGFPSDAPAGASEGERLAWSVCTACHVVAGSQDRPPILRNAAPNFCEIANWPNTTAKSVAYFVTHTHWDENMTRYTMPNTMLTPAEAKAVGAYILTLKGHCEFSDIHY